MVAFREICVFRSPQWKEKLIIQITTMEGKANHYDQCHIIGAGCGRRSHPLDLIEKESAVPGAQNEFDSPSVIASYVRVHIVDANARW